MTAWPLLVVSGLVQAVVVAQPVLEDDSIQYILRSSPATIATSMALLRDRGLALNER
jgi:hypothetical protein